jgi:redox-sensing transcriptional repressor
MKAAQWPTTVANLPKVWYDTFIVSQIPGGENTIGKHTDNAQFPNVVGGSKMATASKAVPDIVVGRLPLYLRALTYLLEEKREITSSQELGDRLGISSAQIRKDLSHFGEFGKQGTGYNIQFLYQQLRRILHLEQDWEVALVGAGDLGHALISYGGFDHTGFRIVAVFDRDPQKIGKKLDQFDILDAEALPTIIVDRGIEVAIIAVPVAEAQSVAKVLVESGVRAILNYAPITLNIPRHIQVQHIDPVIHLQRMTYYLNLDL